MRERRTVTRREMRTALMGMFQPGVIWMWERGVSCAGVKGAEVSRLTCESIPWNGTPLSRANDHNCREPVATSLIVLEVSVTMRMVTMTLVAL